MSMWNDFSDREKLEWLRARLAKFETALGALTSQISEIGDAVKALEAKQKAAK